MRIVLFGASLLMLAAGEARAQAPKLDPNDAGGVAHAELRTLERAMSGVNLGPSQKDSALRIIHTAFRDVFAIDPGDPKRDEKIIALILKRNSTLRSLLRSSADKARFDRNVVDLVPRPLAKPS